MAESGICDVSKLQKTPQLSKGQFLSCSLLEGERSLGNACLKGYHDLRRYIWIFKTFHQTAGIQMGSETSPLLTLFA